MSWLFSQVLVAEYLGDTYLDGEPSVPLSGNNTQLAYLPQDKMTDFSRLSRFGMMFKPLTESLGKELLMSYRADFPAKTYQLLEKAQELTESGQECGKKWHGSFTKFDQDLCLWKTHQCSLIEGWEQFLEIWPNSGSMLNGECWERQILEQSTTEKEYGLLPDNDKFFHTPTTGSSGGSNSRKAMVKRGVTWPTPTTPSGGGQCWRFGGAQKRHQEWDLHTIFNQPEPVRMVDGVAARVDRLKAIGNGQVPQVAAIAWELLTERLNERDRPQ
jgi:hypothetical protein